MNNKNFLGHVYTSSCDNEHPCDLCEYGNQITNTDVPCEMCGESNGNGFYNCYFTRIKKKDFVMSNCDMLTNAELLGIIENRISKGLNEYTTEELIDELMNRTKEGKL
jgi:hypothetical protein